MGNAHIAHIAHKCPRPQVCGQCGQFVLEGATEEQKQKVYRKFREALKRIRSGISGEVGAVFQNYDANNLTKVYVIEANTSWTVPNDFNTSNNTIHLFYIQVFQLKIEVKLHKYFMLKNIDQVVSGTEFQNIYQLQTGLNLNGKLQCFTFHLLDKVFTHLWL